MIKLIEKINKEEMKKKAISGAKSLIIGGLVKVATDPKNRKKLYDYTLNKISYCLYFTQNRQAYEYNKAISWVYDLKNKNVNNNIAILNNNFGLICSIKNGEYRVVCNKCLIIIQSRNQGNDVNDDGIIPDKEIKIMIVGKDSKTLHDKALKYIKCSSDDSFININSNTRNQRYIYKRTMDTIFSDQLDEIKEIVSRWKEQKDIFKEHGLPFKTGILLSGNPGTGKTSIAKAVASEFNMNITYINLATIKPQDLEYMNIQDNSLILLEEIDLIKETENKTDESSYKQKVSVLLNLLDGILSPNNAIIIATSNYKDEIDERILRKGRFDNQIEITDICRETAVRMCKSFNVDPDKVLDKSKEKYNPSELQEKILKIL